jgi:DNA repair exonuclease SbcCD nuclease subunit
MLDEVVLVWRTDVHTADEGPVSRVDNWADVCIDKLEQVNQIAKERKAHAILDGGDLFHRKSPSRNSHSLVQRLLKVHHEAPVETWGNVGNHDVKYGDLRFLEESPLGTLFASGALRPLYDQYEAVFVQGSVKVRVVGIPYHGTTYDMSRFERLVKGDEDWLVCIAHLLASDQGGSMFEGEDIIAYSDLRRYAPDVFCFGHWHKNQGITSIGEGKSVVNIGALTRGSLSQEEVQRIPVAGVLSFTKTEYHLQEVPLKVKPASEVFAVEEKIRKQDREFSMLAFAEKLKATIVQSELSVEDRVRALCVEPAVTEYLLDKLSTV